MEMSILGECFIRWIANEIRISIGMCKGNAYTPKCLCSLFER